MDYGEAIQHLSNKGINTSSYRWYTIDNYMYFHFHTTITEDIRKTFDLSFKEVDHFPCYGAICIDLNKQIIEGAKERLLKNTKKTKAQIMAEIASFNLDEDTTDKIIETKEPIDYHIVTNNP